MPSLGRSKKIAEEAIAARVAGVGVAPLRRVPPLGPRRRRLPPVPPPPPRRLLRRVRAFEAALRPRRGRRRGVRDGQLVGRHGRGGGGPSGGDEGAPEASREGVRAELLGVRGGRRGGTVPRRGLPEGGRGGPRGCCGGCEWRVGRRRDEAAGDALLPDTDADAGGGRREGGRKAAGDLRRGARGACEGRRGRAPEEAATARPRRRAGARPITAASAALSRLLRTRRMKRLHNRHALGESQTSLLSCFPAQNPSSAYPSPSPPSGIQSARFHEGRGGGGLPRGGGPRRARPPSNRRGRRRLLRPRRPPGRRVLARVPPHASRLSFVHAVRARPRTPPRPAPRSSWRRRQHRGPCGNLTNSPVSPGGSQLPRRTSRRALRQALQQSLTGNPPEGRRPRNPRLGRHVTQYAL
mmetsp:Transcript_12030/g.27430  ORF Transcript_12030/g.27430 Transcript_12030/m.27430 type:complete len:410 (-) Transcript_12030:1059-2288(-)